MPSAHLHVNRHKLTEAYNSHDSPALLLSHGSMGCRCGERERGKLNGWGCEFPRGVIRRGMLNHVRLSELVVEMVCAYLPQISCIWVNCVFCVCVCFITQWNRPNWGDIIFAKQEKQPNMNNWFCYSRCIFLWAFFNIYILHSKIKLFIR